TWEPTIKHLIELSDNPRTGIHVDEIWSFEAVNHGDSALINEGKLGDVFDWMDNARDILSFVENYIPDGPFVPTTTPLPTHLPRVSPDVAAERRKQGFKHRNLVGIGHSLGGCSIANAASANSNLFHSLTLVDPIIYFQPSEWTTRFAVSALTRRQRWDSRKGEALLLFKKSPFFGAWKPEVLELYVKYALADIPREKGGGVKLKMSGFSEASVFVEQFFPLETAQQLETLDSMVKLRWIVAGKDVDLEKAALVQEMVWRRIENSANVLIEGAGHLVSTVHYMMDSCSNLSFGLTRSLRRRRMSLVRLLVNSKIWL
ncbi:Alpha/beta hydrolase fold-1, partial [Cantharellus anzutake]|uniref:Alpha/beta hydrolase fold-1 n=1 Tax=Cantharellus anzutake TaxID=1750568 RepID=UPI001904C315